MNKLFTFLVAALLTVSVSAAWASEKECEHCDGNKCEHHGQQHKNYVDALKLDDKRKAEVDAIFSEAKEAKRQIREESKSKIKAVRQAKHDKLAKVLTEEEMTTLKALRMAHKGHHSHGHSNQSGKPKECKHKKKHQHKESSQ